MKLKSLDEVWQEIETFNNQHFPDWRTWDWRLLSNALAGEVGEVCDATKHAYGGGTNSTSGKITRRDIAKEVFDTFVYSALLIGAMEYTKEDYIEICKEKLLILYQRMEVRKTKSVLRQKFNNEA